MRASALKTIAAAAFAATAAISSAYAADMAPRYTKAPPPVVVVWNWTGFYIGGNAGYSWGRSRTDVNYFNTVTGAVIAPPPGSITNANFDMNGAIAGGQAGYNWQVNNWVWGFEGDIQWSDEKGSALYRCAAVAVTAGACLPGLTFLPPGVTGTALAVDQKLEWFGTGRVRGGILVSPQFLLYGTAGFAYGSIKTNGVLSGFNANGVAVVLAGSNSNTRFGWTAGVGGEYLFSNSWSAKVEYLYMDLGRHDTSFTLAPVLPIAGNVSSRFTDHIVRAGINYHFNSPVVAKY